MKRGPKEYPFNEAVAEQILDLIAEGWTLERVCRLKGYPGRWVVARWRRENPEFNRGLAQARDLRCQYFMDKILELVDGPWGNMNEIRLKRLKISVLKWMAGCRDPGTFVRF